MSNRRLVDPDLNLIRDVKVAGGETLKKCYQCATCSVVCELSPDDRPFPRKEMLMAQWGQTDQLIHDPDIWLCHQCNDCSTHCPREAKPGDVLAAVRSHIYRSNAFPKFMGAALASPRSLPALVAVPIVLLLTCILMFAGRTADGGFEFMSSRVVDFNLFLPHSAVDGLFVIGNILIFLLAFIGFKRFWNGLQSSGGERIMSFVQGLILTLKELAAHSQFRKCGANAPRSTGHILVLYGFAGAMATTGCIFIFIFVPHYLQLLGIDIYHSFFAVPINLPNPVKILGALSGASLVIGGGILIFRRWTSRDEVGANGYADYLFLYVLFLSGLTGMGTWLTRLTDIALLAYVTYFIHLVCIYFLLWYMPYSKFAHMFYRTLALVYARQIGREARA
jgi:quinone-modifying oxidoreductase subunit QmoC